MKKNLSIKRAFLLIIVTTMLLPGYAAAADITINYITFVNRMHYYVKTYTKNFEEIEKKSNGRIEFRYRGGPEAVKIFEQAMAVKRGATDMVLTTPSFTGNIVKGPEMLTLSKTPASEYRKKGLYDYLNQAVYNPVGMQFLLVIPEPPGVVFRMMTKSKITNSSQFKGTSTRGGDWMDAVASKFGMQTLAIRFGEDYTAIERGLLNVARSTIISMNAFKIYEVCPYLIKQGWASAPASWVMNLDKWNAIPGDLQNLILDTMYQQAGPTQKLYEDEIQKAEEKLVKEGVQVVELEDWDYFDKTAEKAMYDYFMKEAPEISQKIYELSQ